jgi:hypothetical protein
VPERLDRVTIALPNGDVTISWNTRQALMGRLQHAEERNLIRTRLHNAGASQPVQFSQRQRVTLQRVLLDWSDEEMPAELEGLLNALCDEVADAD